ncbi:YheE family protein [Bacillus salitolerans]|uniref:YheE family protein n=1 Tax=Bacillus salitolerans TaxID=1437434 RepID=A0ABW4LY97_9BACI
MLSHFMYKPLFSDKSLPGWSIRFYYKGIGYEAIYNKDGRITWKNQSPPSDEIDKITTHIHELMLFHVYE